MTDNEIIAMLEEATGHELNESKIKGLIDGRINRALSGVEARAINFGPAAAAGGFSRYLGDVRRLGMGQGARHSEAMVAMPASLRMRSAKGVWYMRP